MSLTVSLQGFLLGLGVLGFLLGVSLWGLLLGLLLGLIQKLLIRSERDSFLQRGESIWTI